MAITHPRVHQINVLDGGVPKLPVPKAYITVQGVEGDRQRSPQYHGGVDRAGCLYSLEGIEALQTYGRRGAPGSSGEDLTLVGLGWARLQPCGPLPRRTHLPLRANNYPAPC